MQPECAIFRQKSHSINSVCIDLVVFNCRSETNWNVYVLTCPTLDDFHSDVVQHFRTIS